MIVKIILLVLSFFLEGVSAAEAAVNKKTALRSCWDLGYNWAQSGGASEMYASASSGRLSCRRRGSEFNTIFEDAWFKGFRAYDKRKKGISNPYR